MSKAEQDRLDSLKKRKAHFLEDLLKYGTVANACRATKTQRSVYYEWYNNDPDFQAAAKEVKAEAVELLEGEVRRRAFQGCKKPVFQGGKKVGTITEYSDTLAMFILKGELPDKYKDRFQGDFTTNANVKLTDLLPVKGKDNE
jgi:hypothetical protein